MISQVDPEHWFPGKLNVRAVKYCNVTRKNTEIVTYHDNLKKS